jgi:hypothetical protein
MSQTARRTATYLYGIGEASAFADATQGFTTAGIDPDGPVRALVHGELAALVSAVPHLRYDISRRNLLAHQRVLEEAMQRATILPVSFGTVASGDAVVIEQVLRRERDELVAQLARVRGRIELDVMAVWERDRLFEEIVAEDRAIRALRDSLLDVPEDSAYYERIELGQRTEAAMQAKSQHLAAAILERLEPLASEVRLNEPLNDTMLLNAAFLVEREREAQFDALMQALGEEAEGRVLFKYIGPLPPHNFVNLSIQWEV